MVALCLSFRREGRNPGRWSFGLGWEGASWSFNVSALKITGGASLCTLSLPLSQEGGCGDRANRVVNGDMR